MTMRMPNAAGSFRVKMLPYRLIEEYDIHQSKEFDVIESRMVRLETEIDLFGRAADASGTFSPTGHDYTPAQAGLGGGTTAGSALAIQLIIASPGRRTSPVIGQVQKLAIESIVDVSAPEQVFEDAHLSDLHLEFAPVDEWIVPITIVAVEDIDRPTSELCPPDES